jgi:hypothetical protein
MSIQFPNALASLCVPNANHLVVSAADDSAGIVRDLHTGKAALMTGEGADKFFLANAPHPDSSITRGRDDKVVLDGDSVDWSRVTGKLVHESESFAIPDANGGILGAGYNMILIECDVEDSSLMVGKALEWDVVWKGPNDARVIA